MRIQAHAHPHQTIRSKDSFGTTRNTMSTFKFCILLGKWSLLLDLLIVTPPFGIPSGLTPLSVVMGVLFVLMLLEDFRGTHFFLNPEPLLEQPIDLQDSESVMQKDVGLRQTGINQLAGRIIATTERIIFEPASDQKSSAPIILLRNDISSVEHTWSTVFGFIPLFKTGLCIQTRTGKQLKLSVHNPQHWLAQLSC